MTPDEAQLIRVDLHRVEKEVAELSSLIKTEGLRCPYRESIARASNNIERIKENTAAIGVLESRVTSHDISLARLLVLMTGSGGFGGALVALVNYLATKGTL